MYNLTMLNMCNQHLQKTWGDAYKEDPKWTLSDCFMSNETINSCKKEIPEMRKFMNFVKSKDPEHKWKTAGTDEEQQVQMMKTVTDENQRQQVNWLHISS